jgi:hypothetical protein
MIPKTKRSRFAMMEFRVVRSCDMIDICRKDGVDPRKAIEQHDNDFVPSRCPGQLPWY